MCNITFTQKYKFVDGSFSLYEHFSLLDFLGCFFLFVGELFGVVGELLIYDTPSCGPSART